MEIKSRFDHFNINVTDLDRSIAFYDKALGLRETGRKEASDGGFTLVYLGDGQSPFRLELTWLRDHAAVPYELGENESHLCMRVAGDYDAVREYHRAMGCVCYENPDMGLYFINDPDDYWIEILPLNPNSSSNSLVSVASVFSSGVVMGVLSLAHTDEFSVVVITLTI